MAGRIRIRLKAFDHAVIDQASADIVPCVSIADARDPVPLAGDGVSDVAVPVSDRRGSLGDLDDAAGAHPFG